LSQPKHEHYIYTMASQLKVYLPHQIPTRIILRK